MPWNARVEITRAVLASSFSADVEGDVVKHVEACLAASYGRETERMGEGASIPLAENQSGAFSPAVATYTIQNGAADPFLLVFDDQAGQLSGLASLTYTDFSGALAISIPSPGAGATA